jgi:hypothetical protein
MDTLSALNFRVARMKGVIALGVVAVFLTSCATAGDPARTDRARADRARTEGMLVGAGIGSAVGGGLGYLAGGNGVVSGVGAAIGAAIGGTVGYVYADQVAKRHARLAGKENELDARIALARGVNEDTEHYNRRLKGEVTELEAKIAELEAGTKQGTITREKVAEEKQLLSTKIEDANRQLALADDELQRLKNLRAERKQSSEALDEQIRALESNLAEMRTTTTALASLNQRI